jgi:hypothetical protein
MTNIHGPAFTDTRSILNVFGVEFVKALAMEGGKSSAMLTPSAVVQKALDLGFDLDSIVSLTEKEIGIDRVDSLFDLPSVRLQVIESHPLAMGYRYFNVKSKLTAVRTYDRHLITAVAAHQLTKAIRPGGSVLVTEADVKDAATAISDNLKSHQMIEIGLTGKRASISLLNGFRLRRHKESDYQILNKNAEGKLYAFGEMRIGRVRFPVECFMGGQHVASTIDVKDFLGNPEKISAELNKIFAIAASPYGITDVEIKFNKTWTTGLTTGIVE